MITVDDPVTFGEWVKQRRRSLDLTQSELADRSGCSVFALRKIESGERRPSKQLANLLARSLEIPVEDVPQFLKVARGDLNLSRLPAPKGVSPANPNPISVGMPRYVLHLDYPNSFVGREEELKTLGNLLEDPDCRLLTLTGTGGIGKTRLAVETAKQSQKSFTGGVCFVSLAGVQNPSSITPTLAEALGLNFHGHEDSLRQIQHYLQAKNLLILIDNAEHLLAGAKIFEELLTQAPGVKIMVTSRERLNLRLEWVFEIHGLPTPQSGQSEDFSDFSSIQLFIQSARRANAAFILHDEDGQFIAHICRLLGGMPLGIELAASWVPYLSCQAILVEMERSLDFLKSTHKDIPDRQRSLRAAFEYSWALLSEPEQHILAGLAIFRGGFDREEALEVVQADLETLQSLAAKSLIIRQAGSRFDLHEVIRQFALEHLKSAVEYDSLLDRHSHAYLALLMREGQLLKSSRQVEALQKLRYDIHNIRAAWDVVIDRTNFAFSDDSIRSLGWFCDISGLMDEGILMLEHLVAAAQLNREVPSQTRMIGLSQCQLGLLYFRKGNFQRAMQFIDEGLTSLRPLKEPALLTDGLLFGGVIFHLYGDFETSRRFLQEGLDCARLAGDMQYVGYAIFNLGYVDGLTGSYESGYHQMLEGLDIWRNLGDFSTIALGLNHISIIALKLGRISEAQSYLEESIQLCLKVDDRWGLGTAYRYLGLTGIYAGKVLEARQYLLKSLAILSEMTSGWDLIRSNIYLAQTFLMEEDFTHAGNLWADSFQQAVTNESFPLALEALTGLAKLEIAMGNNEKAYIYACFIQTQAACTQITIEEAVHIAAAASLNIFPERLKSADEQSRSLTYALLQQEIYPTRH